MGQHFQRLFAGVPDAGQRSVSRLIEPHIHRDDSRQWQSDCFNAFINFTIDRNLRFGEI